MLLLIFNLIMVMKPEWIGFTTTNTETTLTTMRISFITVGIWWIGFSSIPFYYLPSHKKNGTKSYKKIFFLMDLRNCAKYGSKLTDFSTIEMVSHCFFLYIVWGCKP